MSQVCIWLPILSRDRKFESQLGHIIFVEIDPKIISTAIRLLPQVQEGQLV